ncbi:DUF4892 domain-containing protein [Marinobacter oulmenensis]|uniref:DUF4892 domain-containing protein n=1 Tax=Marinobacter oulmenensis TaxID=643747 RepID=A0A840UDY3_9GAMM|nr:DUF4892 domain-containing protein [Marinobacter oulmenensis]MBB5320655.1 hypothetical protein [Marinobacter oulmenensis]
MTERRVMPTLTFLLLALTTVQPAMAAPLEEPPEPFAQSTLQSTKRIESSGHLVLFSPIREIRDEIRSDVMARLPVQGVGQLYELNRDATRAQARDHYRQSLQGREARILFECVGIDCGRSNVWANQVFEQSRLLGRDREQDYLVAATMDSAGQRWLTLVYTVTRGNLREYVWVEHLQVEPGAPIPGFAATPERVRGPIVVPWQGGVTYRFEFSAADRRQVTDWASGEGSVVVLAGFSELRDNETFDEGLVRAGEAVDSLADLLAKVGVGRDQIRKLPVGSGVAVPGPNRQGNRVEVLVIEE